MRVISGGKKKEAHIVEGFLTLKFKSDIMYLSIYQVKSFSMYTNDNVELITIDDEKYYPDNSLEDIVEQINNPHYKVEKDVLMEDDCGEYEICFLDSDEDMVEKIMTLNPDMCKDEAEEVLTLMKEEKL